MSKLEEILLQGLASARPAATAVGTGSLYFSTDTEIIEQSDGAVWSPYSGVGSGSSYWTTELTQAADQDVDGTTLTDSTNLQLAVTAGDVWHILLVILYSADGATNDFLWDVAVSTGNMSGNGWHNCMNGSDTANIAGLGFAEITNGTNVVAGTAAAHGIRAFQAEFTLRFSANGTFTFRFAENTSTTGVARLRAGSKLFAHKISP